MEITKKHLIEIIQDIGAKIDELNAKINIQAQQLAELKSQNNQLKKTNQDTLDQIKEYIEELEQIRNHYVDSNNRTG